MVFSTVLVCKRVRMYNRMYGWVSGDFCKKKTFFFLLCFGPFSFMAGEERKKQKVSVEFFIFIFYFWRWTNCEGVRRTAVGGLVWWYFAYMRLYIGTLVFHSFMCFYISIIICLRIHVRKFGHSRQFPTISWVLLLIARQWEPESSSSVDKTNE